MSLAKHYTNFGDTKGQPPEENTLGWASRGGILGWLRLCTFNAGDVGSIPSWEYPACLLAEKKKNEKTIRIHKCSLNEKR